MNDAPQAFWDVACKAQKEHKCCECSSTIALGEEYHHISGIWEQEYAHYKQCAPCNRLMVALINEYDPEYGPGLTCLREWLLEWRSWERPEVTAEDIERLQLDSEEETY